MAYAPQRYELTMPEWMRETFFDLYAKVPAGATRDSVRVMLQELLAARFKLRMHRESKLQAGYILRRGTSESKLIPSPPLPPDGPNLTPVSRVRFTLDKQRFFIFPPGYTNVIAPVDADGVTHLTAARQTMAEIAYDISRRLQQPVVDDTGLKGIFDYHLLFAADEANTGETPEAASEPAPTLVRAVESQLGLKLAPSKLPVNILVIDHIEKTPVEN